MDVPLGKVSCRRLRSQSQVPFTESPSLAEEPCRGRGLLQDSHPALLSASHGHSPPSRGQATTQRKGHGRGGLDKGERPWATLCGPGVSERVG